MKFYVAKVSKTTVGAIAINSKDRNDPGNLCCKAQADDIFCVERSQKENRAMKMINALSHFYCGSFGQSKLGATFFSKTLPRQQPANL